MALPRLTRWAAVAEPSSPCALLLLLPLDHLEDEAWLRENLEPLGREHLAYGVTPEMYDWVGDALVASIAEVCDDDWTQAHEGAWKNAYGRIAAIMRRGELTKT